MGDFQSINWRSRGYLPHFDAPGFQQHIVFGLADAISGRDANHTDDALTAFDAVLDRGLGDCVLSEPACASAVQEALLHDDGEHYSLLAWCIMPNHVHAVIDQRGDLAAIVRRWKTWSARQINARLKRAGRVWRREYFDRYARNEGHLGAMIAYVENNPVNAGLVSTPKAWLWSSASLR